MVENGQVGCEILSVSPLAYPNLLGTKGFVVVVVGLSKVALDGKLWW